MGKILRVNLSNGEISEESIADNITKKFIGGAGLPGDGPSHVPHRARRAALDHVLQHARHEVRGFLGHGDAFLAQIPALLSKMIKPLT